MIETSHDYSLNGKILWNRKDGTISELLQWVPRFTMAPFEIKGEGKHPHRYVIVREPLRKRPKESQDALLPADDDTVQMLSRSFLIDIN